MFNVGDRVEIKSERFPEFNGKLGEVRSNWMYHMFDGWQAFEVLLDEPFQPSFLQEVVRYYTAQEQELIHTTIPKPLPPKKRKWYQWGTKNY